MSLRFLRSLLFLFLASSASAQTIGQYELRKRTSTGFTAYGITLSNGQVIGQTAGVPAAITPLVSGDLSAYLTSATAASTYQPLATLLTSFAGLSNAAGVLTNNGSGTLSYTATSAGGFGTADSAKIPYFNSSGGLQVADLAVYSSGQTNPQTGFSATAVRFRDTQGDLGQLTIPGLAGSRTWQLPDNSTASTQIIVTQMDVGTVTSTMLAGSIANSKLAVDPLNASNLTSGTVPTARLGSGTANSTTYLRGDNTWATVTGGVTSITGTANEITVTGTTTPTLSLPSALTFTGKTITGGTFSSPTLTTPALGTPSNVVLTNGSGLPIAGLTGLGTGAATAFSNAVNATGGLLTYAIIGTSGGTIPLLNAANTWSANQTFNGVDLKWTTDGIGNIGAASASRPNTVYAYYFNAGGSSFGGNNLALISGAGAVYWNSGTIIEPVSVDGNIKFSNYARNDFGRMQFGGTTSSFPALKRSGAGLIVRLADDSANASLTTGNLQVGSNGTAITQLKRATCTLVAGTATISDTDTTANTHISIMVSTSAGTIGTGYTVTVSAGTGYTITAIGSVLETSTLVLKATHF